MDFLLHQRKPLKPLYKLQSNYHNGVILMKKKIKIKIKISKRIGLNHLNDNCINIGENAKRSIRIAIIMFRSTKQVLR